MDKSSEQIMPDTHRFSDEQLSAFYEAFLSHGRDEVLYREQQDLRWKETNAQLHEMAYALERLRAEHDEHITLSNDLLDAWEASKGFVTVGKVISKVFQAVGALATAGFATYAAYHTFISSLSTGVAQ